MHKIKDVDRIILTLAGYITDAAQEVRANARLAFIALRGAYGSEGEFERMVSRTLPDAVAIKIREAMEQEPQITVAPEVTTVISPKRPPLSVRKPQKTYAEPQEPEFADIPQLAAEITHSEWKRRYDAVDRTLALVTTHADSLKSSAKLVTVIDLLNKALGDANLSVTLHALSGMTRVIPMLAGTLEPHSTLIVHALVVAIASANSAIRDAARHTLHALMRHCDFTYSIPALMGVIPQCAPKAKPTLLALLCGEMYSDFLPEVHAKKPSLVHKHLLPLTFKLLDDPKQEIRSECYKLVHALYAVIGSVLVECTPASKLQKVMDLLNE